LEKTQISARQLMFLLLAYLVPATLTFSIGAEVKQDAWLTVIIGMASSLGLALLYLTLANRFPGLSLIAINDQVWGLYLGKVCSMGFIIFYLFINSLAVAMTADFQKVFLPKTPALILALLEVGIAILLVSAGLEVLARCCHIFGYFHITIWSLLFLANLPAIDFTNFQPMLQTPWPLLGFGSLFISVFTADALMPLMMIFPQVHDAEKMYAAAVKSFIIAGGYVLMGFFFTFGILGPTADQFTYPTLNATRIIDIGEVFSRMELFFGIIFYLGAFFRQTLFFYNLTKASGEFFNLKSPQTLCLPFGILLSLLSIHTFTSSADNLRFAMQIYPWLIFPLPYLYPALTLLVAALRKLPRQNLKPS
jgi:spore germination protein KB